MGESVCEREERQTERDIWLETEIGRVSFV